MTLNPRFGNIGMVILPYYILFEIMGPVIEVLGYPFVIMSYFLGILSLDFLLLFLALAILLFIAGSIFVFPRTEKQAVVNPLVAIVGSGSLAVFLWFGARRAAEARLAREVNPTVYPVNEFRGRKAALASLEYRFPLRDIESGIGGNMPLYLRRLHGALFAEAGNAWDDAFRSRDFKRSVGAEARIDVYFAYYVPLTFRIGLAKGLDEKKETFLIFNLWAPALF